MVSGADGTRGGNYFRHANLIREWRAAIHMLSNAKQSIKIQKIFWENWADQSGVGIAWLQM